MEFGARDLAASTLRSLLFIGRGEEKRLRGILADHPTFLVKMQTRSELEKVLKQLQVQLEEFEKLNAAK